MQEHRTRGHRHGNTDGGEKACVGLHAYDEWKSTSLHQAQLPAKVNQQENASSFLVPGSCEWSALLLAKD